MSKEEAPLIAGPSQPNRPLSIRCCGRDNVEDNACNTCGYHTCGDNASGTRQWLCRLYC